MADFITDNITVLCGDWLQRAKEIPGKSVQVCVTSPPFWGLRDYGTATWEGGDAECDHTLKMARQDTGRDIGGRGGNYQTETPGTIQYRDICGKCGAKRIDLQIGLEATPKDYVEKMVEVFAEVWRVLRDDGTCWLNLGSSYSSGPRGKTSKTVKDKSEIRSDIVTVDVLDGSEPFALRDDLTVDELAYVLAELSRFIKGDEVT